MKKFIIIVAALLVAGCARTVYVPREVVKVEYRDRVEYDSVYVRDSILVRERGDTVYVYVDRWRDRFHTLRDTLRLVDSVSYPVPYEVVKQVRHIPQVYRWAFGFSLLALGWGAFRLIRKFKIF